MHKKTVTIDRSKKSTKSKRIGRKTVSSRKAASNKKSKMSTNIRKNSKRLGLMGDFSQWRYWNE